MSSLLDLHSERFVSLTTFRKSGERVSTPVWIAKDGDALIVTTPAESGKVKRLRNSDRVELQPCTRMGKVIEGTSPIAGSAEILEDAKTVERYGATFLNKYKLEYRIFMLIERIAKKGTQSTRVMLRITEPSA